MSPMWKINTKGARAMFIGNRTSLNKGGSLVKEAVSRCIAHREEHIQKRRDCYQRRKNNNQKKKFHWQRKKNITKTGRFIVRSGGTIPKVKCSLSMKEDQGQSWKLNHLTYQNSHGIVVKDKCILWRPIVNF